MDISINKVTINYDAKNKSKIESKLKLDNFSPMVQ